MQTRSDTFYFLKFERCYDCDTRGTALQPGSNAMGPISAAERCALLPSVATWGNAAPSLAMSIKSFGQATGTQNRQVAGEASKLASGRSE